GYQLTVVVSYVLVVTVLLGKFIRLTVDEGFLVPLAHQVGYAGVAILYLTWFLTRRAGSDSDDKASFLARSWLLLVSAEVGSFLSGAGLLWLTGSAVRPWFRDNAQADVTFGPPLLLLVLAVVAAIRGALLSNLSSKESRERWSILSGRLIRLATVWTGLFS